MSDRLTDEQVRWHADAKWRYSQARLDYTSEQFDAEVEALAREVQERRAMRCETCEHARFPLPKFDVTEVGLGCARLPALRVRPDWFCADWEARDELVLRRLEGPR